MLLKVKLKGKGTQADPYRVSLPTYTIVHGNVAQEYAIVSVPDETLGVTPADLKDEEVEETTEGVLYPKLSDALVEKIHGNLDERYQEHAGEYRLREG